MDKISVCHQFIRSRNRSFLIFLFASLFFLSVWTLWTVIPTPAEESTEEKSAPFVEEMRLDKRDVARAIEVKRRHEYRLLNIPGVVGAGVGYSHKTGGVAIKVYVEKLTPRLERLIPPVLEGVLVEIRVTGEVEPAPAILEVPKVP